MRAGPKLSLALIAGLLMPPLLGAAGIDLHLLWDDRCVECHGHAGEFARKFLGISGDKLQGRHHVDDLRRFLHNHYLIDSEVDAVYDMLFAQASNQARFRQECGNCHEGAAKLVREKLALRDGVLYARDSGVRVRYFLDHHRELGSEDVVFYENLLTRIAREIYRP